MQEIFMITPELKATFDIWIASPDSDTLLINAHGMQAAEKLEPNSDLPECNYAFTVPWGTAMMNSAFKNNETNLQRYVTTFKARSTEFSSTIPRLAIYPFLFDLSWRPTFDKFAQRNQCDIAHFFDLEGPPKSDYIMLDDFLRQKHWKGGTIGAHYSSILLLTCRSDMARGVGLGGAEPTYPNGIYKADGLAPHISII